MSKVFSILCIIPLFFLILITFAAHKIMEADFNEFEEYRLQKTNNYATDAAIEELLISDDLDQDYINLKKITLDPLKAYDSYLTVLALSYDMPIDNEVKESLAAQYLDLMVVAVYDGYYVFHKDGAVDAGKDKTTSYTALPTMKYPYLYHGSDGLYSLDMSISKCLKLTGSGITKVDLPISRSQALVEINKTINDVVASNIVGSSQANAYIPVEATTIGTAANPVDSITVLAFINGVDFNSSKKLNAFSVGGAKIDVTRMIACYKRDGKKMYCYTDLIPPSIANPANIEEWADYVVPSMEDAAKLGYSCDLELMR